MQTRQYWASGKLPVASTAISCSGLQHILIAQWIERLATNEKVGGSNPSKDARGPVQSG